MKKLQRAIVFFTICFVGTTLPAQKRIKTDSLLVQQFGSGVKLEWQKVFFARLDDVTELELHLGYDGTQCNGWGRYVQSNLVHTFQGFVNDASLFLVELDPQRNPIATIEATIDTRKIKGQRIITGRKAAKQFEGELLSGKEASERSDANKWYRKYATKWNDKPVHITLARLQSDMILGHFCVEDGVNYAIKGRAISDDKFQAQLTNLAGGYVGSIKGSLLSGSKMSFTLEMPKSPKAYLHSTLEEQLNVKCTQERVGNLMLDAVYPRTKLEQLNTLLDSKLDSWLAQVKGAHLASASPKAEQLASMWADVTCWQEDLVCVLLTTHASLDTSWQAQAVLFNTKKKKQLEISDFFQDRFNYQSWFKGQVLKHLPGIPEYQSDPKFKTWVDQNGFEVIYLRNDGIVLSTTFHPVYGTTQILLNWETLKPYLKPLPILKDFVR